MIILGLDPGTTRIGFGVIKKDDNFLSHVDYGILSVRGADHPDTLLSIHQALESILDKYKPGIVGLERLFFFSNKKTAIAVSEARGALILTLARRGIPIYEFTPLQVKQAVSSYGRAGKDQIERMVRLLLKINDPVRPDDAADALAIAICCANSIIAPSIKKR